MRKPGLWTLRTRLVVAILALTAVGLVLADVVGAALLRGYLIDRLDQQLTSNATALARVSTAFDFTSLQLPTEVIAKRLAVDNRFYVYAPDGSLAYLMSPEADDPQLPPFAELAARGGQEFDVPSDSGPWRVAVQPALNGGVAVVAGSLRPILDTESKLNVIQVLVTAAVLLLLGAAGAAVVRLGLRPLTRMELASSRIASGDFAHRAPGPDPHTEPGRLALAMNVMLDRVEREIAARSASEVRLRQFLADASHELRTPLTSVRGFAELYRHGGSPPGPELDETMRRIEEEATRMGVLVQDLLTLAALDQERPLDRRPVDLLEIAADTIRDARARVPERKIRLMPYGTGPLMPVIVPGDDARLRQVLTNLVSNALTHTPAEAEITVRVGVSSAQGVVEVADTGPGIPAEDAPYIFERLYRASRSRSRSDGGAGLGLAIVAAIVRAHGGRVELGDEPGGARFRILLPR
ncbi:sensor histidine kinase [Acrocarpospora pleiomorpha]|uniref:sensor histidine kinase n=1 Tax=Acrocarpospora pleiomorpha TaxID=90975 RepID=UPI0012D3579C|nr:HAMP domain-containing sensor histidine kinase [Acrocarpospora pleiomorpha]